MADLSRVRGFDGAFEALLRGLEGLRREVDAGQVNGFVGALVDARRRGGRVFVYGAGRSLLVGRAFSMRLMHLGFGSYVVGETVTPAVERGDVLVVVSRALSHASLRVVLDEAESLGARVLMVTSGNGESRKRADCAIVVPDRGQSAGEGLPLGTLFEVSVLVFLDCVVAELMSRLGVSEEEMEKRHANIE